MAEVEMVALADRDEQILRQTAEEFNIVSRYTDYRGLLKDKRVDIAVICTPTPLHYEIIMEAIAQGKHILVEKPMVLSLNEAVEIYKKLRQTKLKLCIVQNHRFNPNVLNAKKRISEGFIGNIVSIHGKALSNFPNGWTRSRWLYHGGGALYDFGPHLVDIVLWIMDQAAPKRVSAFGGSYSEHMGFITQLQALIEFSDKSTVSLDISWLTGSLLFNLDIHGTAGRIMVEPLKNQFHEFHGSLTPFDEVKWFWSKMKHTVDGLLSGKYFVSSFLAYQELMAGFLYSIVNDTTPPVPIKNGLMVNLVLAAIESSIKEKRTIELTQFARGHELNVAELGL
jgi:predicted dehydrogenase